MIYNTKFVLFANKPSPGHVFMQAAKATFSLKALGSDS